jgi:hypothetical protein
MKQHKRADRFTVGNLEWQARHLATLLDREPTEADIFTLVKHSTTVLVSRAQHERLLESARWAYFQLHQKQVSTVTPTASQP